ncbi:MAG: UvrD-helicase domain-containing protein [Proteobacteria bacterium]|nr:UvrD-helicase domain-containing protein [Pseudomonadota bacterium]
MRFHADLHLHSRHSRATGAEADLEHYAHWARLKGIGVLATGDFTHPAWLAELKEKLVPAEPGLFALRANIERAVGAGLPAACQGPVRFMLEVEISTIYKKGDLTRKIHHLIYVPDFAAADRLIARLSRIGNLGADGRPILGLDSRDLLEITIESSPDAYLVPAHIWTPWFAALGSRSGFDSIVECYGDLSPHIFALETGLSSDPPMNWRVSALDRYRLVSNSDAHSPPKLGREATLFDADLDYFAIRKALESGEGYVGTVEFFPEEGKYHLDGHRKCGVRLTPEQTKAERGRCPVCGQPITVGVMHRVESLADRGADRAAPPATAGALLSLVPLPEILSEIAGAGPASRRVGAEYGRITAALGPELAILEAVAVDDIARAGSAVLAEAIARLRAGKVSREAGYDGEYGVIRLFDDAELRDMRAGGLLFDLPPAAAPGPEPAAANSAAPDAADDEAAPAPRPARAPRDASATGIAPLLAGLDDEQRAAAAHVRGPLLIVAGPGSGKTRTLTHRIAHLIADHGVAPEGCLALTFTRRAAAEMAERLAALLPREAPRVPVHTFHSLGLAILREHPGAAGLNRGFEIADEGACAALLAETLGVSERTARAHLRAISLAGRTGSPAGDGAAETLGAYRRAMARRNWVDLDDLVGLALRALESEPALAALYRKRYPFVSVDEFQDVDRRQYGLLRLLAPAGANLCVIGDADQAIYGFRGADPSCFAGFSMDYPGATVARLTRNYRSIGTIVAASAQVMAAARPPETLAEALRESPERIAIHGARSDRAEAEFVVQTIERLIGGHSFFSIDSGRGAGAGARLSFSDFAVLYRAEALAPALAEALARSGMPFRRHSHDRLADDAAVKALMAALGREPDGGGSLPLGVRLARAADSLAAPGGALAPTAIEAALQRLAVIAEGCCDDRDRFADTVRLASAADGWDPRADAISLLTLHAAKGLEFPVVFIVGLEDGVLPLRFGSRAADDLAEERRLLYVGMTRAKDHLILTRAERRAWQGAVRALPPSPYLRDIEAGLLNVSRTAARRTREPERQLALF